ncbi:DNA-binding XRE family transcriptional regulator [Phyllobacterium bourgognense]|uniref:DNA-binding XRE family transcriptional regulator n=2 Tax=Phyllobacterium bourgognense TaxID=314236 RepID=A0A368YIX6_9HYPH|nr:DNA-binding XRE family transcriptional regulator [Phyllobacterium bourgognense]
MIPLARPIPTNLRRLSADREEKDEPKPSLLCPNSTTKLVLQTLSFVENTPWLNTLQESALVVMGIREIFARNLRTLRQAKDLSQEELAHRAGIDRTYISALERNVYNASIDVVDRLAEALGVEAAELLKRSVRDLQGTKPKLDEGNQ